MRRVQNDTTSTSQAVRNLATNPEMVAGVSDKVIRTNLFTNPSFETAGSQFNVRTNLSTNPSFETSSGTVDIKTNLATNPSFERVAEGTDILRKNLATAGWYVITYTGTGASNTTGVSWQGKTWTRFTQGTTTAAISRLNIPLTELVDGQTYTVSWLVANTSASAIWIGIDWCDGPSSTLSLAPGEQRRVSVTSSRSTYTSVYRFADLYLTAPSTSVLFTEVLVEQTDQQRPYFDGDTADALGWDYGWTGTAGSSVSTARAMLTEITRNMIPNPKMNSVSASTFELRKNLAVNPRAVDAFGPYGTQTITTVTGLSGFPDGITTANRVAFNGANPGVTFFTPLANTTYTVSAWVFHESVPAGGWAFAQRGVTSSPSTTPVQGAWSRLSWTYTTGESTSEIGFRSGVSQTSGSFLITGILVEEGPTLGSYFDGSLPATTDHTHAWLGAPTTSTSVQRAYGVVDYSRSGADTSSPYSYTDPVAGKVLRYRFTTGINAVAINLTSLSNIPAMEGKTYTILFKARASFAYSIKGRVGGTQGDSVTLPANQWVTVRQTLVYGVAGYTGVWMTNTGSANIGQTIDLADICLVEGIYTGPYFDGASPSYSDFSHKWTGTPDNSASVVAGARVLVTGTGRTNAVYSYDWLNSGTSSMRVIANNSDSYDTYIEPVPMSTFAPSTQYTVSAKVRKSAPQTGPLLGNSKAGLFWHFNAGEVAGNVHSTNVAGVETLTATFTTPASLAGYSTFRLYNGTPRGNGDIWYDDLVIVQGSGPATYFDGDTPASDDLTYVWSGTPHASTSVVRGTPAAGYSTNNCYAIQSSQFPLSGSKSLRLIPSSSSNDSFIYIPITLGAKTYTISATIRLKAPQTGTLDDRARRIRVFHSDIVSASEIAPNVVGSTRLKVTFTVTDATKYQSLRLYNGGTTGNGDVWWENLVVEEGATDGKYFDGTAPVYENLCPNPSFESSLGVWNQVAYGSVSRDTTQGYVGSACTKITVTGAVDGAYYSGGHASVRPGDVVTMSAYIKGPAGKAFRVDGDAGSSATNGWVVDNFKSLIFTGDWQRVSITITVPVGYDRATIGFKADAVWSGEMFVDAILIEKSATLNPYYEGTGDYTYAWSGTSHASTSYQKAISVAGWSNPISSVKLVSSSILKTHGASSLMVVGTSDGNRTTLTTFPASAGAVYALSADMRHDASVSRELRIDYTFQDSNNARIGNYVAGIGVTAAGGLWVRPSTVTIAAPANTATITVYTAIISATASETFWVDAALAEDSAILRPYFDGSSTNTGDFTHAWSGTANASTSSQRAWNVAGAFTNMRADIYSSSVAPFSGSSTAKGIVTEVGYQPRYEQLFTIIPGRRYTVMVKMKASTGPVNLGLKWIANPDVYGPVISEAASNGVWTTVRGSAISPDNATHLALWIGVPSNTVIGTEFEIDQLMVVSKDYNGPFGTGDSYGWEWEGTPHASTSIGYPVGMMQLAGKPLFFQTTPGQYVLTDIDPAKNPVLPEGAPRTIYTVVNNLKDIDTGQMSVVFTYGVDDLNDATHPNQTIMMRQQSQSGSTVNALLARRTGGGGPVAIGIPSTGKQILINGLNENGYLFSGANKDAITTDTGIQMVVPHERIKIEPNNTHHQHIATYIYPGVHSAAVRQEMVKLLAHEYAIPGM